MFFYGYVLTQLPGGRLAELVGAKWLFGGGEDHNCCSHHDWFVLGEITMLHTTNVFFIIPSSSSAVPTLRKDDNINRTIS